MKPIVFERMRTGKTNMTSPSKHNTRPQGGRGWPLMGENIERGSGEMELVDVENVDDEGMV